MRRALSITLLCTAALAAAMPAAAQQPPARATGSGQALGLRYLSWPGHTGTPSPVATRTGPSPRLATPAPTPAVVAQPVAAVIPHGVPAMPAAAAPARSLTPATAWMRAPSPSAAAPTPTAPPSPEPPAAADPMAPRRDALIFHLQRPTGTPQPQAQPQARTDPPAAPPQAEATVASSGPAEQGARYYSVHRQNNRRPDPTPLPAPTYVDAIAVNLPDSMASQDLAAPPEPPTLVRNSSGRLQAMPDTSTPDQS